MPALLVASRSRTSRSSRMRLRRALRISRERMERGRRDGVQPGGRGVDGGGPRASRRGAGDEGGGVETYVVSVGAGCFGRLAEAGAESSATAALRPPDAEDRVGELGAGVSRIRELSAGRFTVASSAWGGNAARGELVGGEGT